ncbi:MAG: hypothetical protein CBD10_004145 [Alphaproteobacteria bacterium TMED150]|nr:hypothetical protein [Paracoccaceae bacterium]RPH13662.1 MAG: hypothetical protein CBD10_004145 [Alphaproteobacteria bacterium TMED150]HCJ62663.1 hypothetical protein [Alphaproteobacteria bacterium]|tara:strand:- start:1102 stop:1929 length:828 start_codon:yes stop_codon:yes gene_type:complete
MSTSYSIHVPNASKEASLLINANSISSTTTGDFVLIINQDIRYSVSNNMILKTEHSWEETVKSTDSDASMYETANSRNHQALDYEHVVEGDENITIHDNNRCQHSLMNINTGNLTRESKHLNLITDVLNTNVGNSLTISGSTTSTRFRIGYEINIAMSAKTSISMPFNLAITINKTGFTYHAGLKSSVFSVMIELKRYKVKNDQFSKREFYTGSTLEIALGFSNEIYDVMQETKALTLELNTKKERYDRTFKFLSSMGIDVAGQSTQNTKFNSRI